MRPLTDAEITDLLLIEPHLWSPRAMQRVVWTLEEVPALRAKAAQAITQQADESDRQGSLA